MVSQELQQFLFASRARLRAAVEGVAPDRLVKRPTPQRWSPLEVMEHLAIGEEWYLQIVSGLVEEGRHLGLRYREGQPRNMDAVNSLSAQIDIRKPQVAASFAQPTGITSLPLLLARLDLSRRGLLDLLPDLDELDTDRLCFRHPTLHFELNAYQWVHLSGLHDRMHTRQIRHALESAP
jgi:hypothetical protein